MVKYILAVLLAVTLTGCAGYNVYFNKYTDQTTHNG
jgi:hypothetical protein